MKTKRQKRSVLHISQKEALELLSQLKGEEKLDMLASICYSLRQDCADRCSKTDSNAAEFNYYLGMKTAFEAVYQAIIGSPGMLN